MSGIYIKGMEMPTSCSVCDLFGEYGCSFIGAVGDVLTRGERNDNCPLVPAADVVEVVRCKDCKYSELWEGHRTCEWHGFTDVNDDYFCADGERRSE